MRKFLNSVRISFAQSALMAGLVFPMLVLTLFASTEKTALGQDLPSGESVLQKYIEASGGQAAFDKINNRFLTANLEILNAGIVLSVKTYAAKPNKILVILESEAVGEVRQGCTGDIAWSMSDMQGPVIEEAAALENKLRDSMFDRLVYWKQAYQSAECQSVEKIDDQEFYKVVLTPKPYEREEAEEAEPSMFTVYLDTSTYLPGKIESNVVTEAGTIDVTAYPSDFKTVDDIKISHTTKIELAGQTRVMTIESVKHNDKFAADQFDPPAEIQELLQKK